MRWMVGLVTGLPLAALAADPQIASFIDTPDPVPAGGVYEYALRIDNNQADAAQNTRLAVTVPAGATFVSAAPAGANCVQQSPTTVQCNLGLLGGGGLDVRDVTLRWRALGPGPSTINATATLSSDNDINNSNNTQTATTSVISGANLSLAKSGSPNPVVGGALLSYTLTAANAGPNASGDIVITDNLPPAVAFVSSAGAGWSCAHAAGVVTCSRSGPHAVGAAIPALGIVGRVNASGGTVTNSATVAPATGGVADPDSTDNTATADTTVLPGADVRIAQKTVTSVVPAVAGTDVSFLIQPRNAGPADAGSVTVSDPLPAGWSFVSASGPGWSCSHAAGTVSCTRALLTTAATDDITVVARAPGNAAVGATGSSFTNTASISTATPDPDGGNNSGSVTVNVLPDGADLRLDKAKTPNPVAQGSNMTSLIAVTNNGPRVATGPLRVVERLVGESYVSFTGAGWACDGSAPPLVVCTHANAGGLAVGASLTRLAVVTRADVAGGASNTACTGGSVPATVSAALASPPVEGDPNPGNDCATTTSTSTSVQPDLAITKLTSTPAGGDKTVSTSESAVTYTLAVSNVSLSPQAATGVRITDTVPAFIAGRSSFAAVTAVASGGSTATFACSTSGAAVQCDQTGGQLLQGQSVTVAITVNRPLMEGSFTNRGTVTNLNEGDPNLTNNDATDTVVIEPIADVQMTGKTVSPASVRAGEVATYVLSFRNNGPSPAQGVTVTDSFGFPGGDSGVTVTQVQSSASGSSCSIAAGAVLNPASPSFSCTIGQLANGQTESITLRVRPNFQPGNGARSFGNLARVNTTSVENPAGGDNGNNEQSATLAVTAAAVDLLVNKTDRVGALNLDPVGFVPGSTFLGYQVAVTNNGPSFATGVQVTEVMTPPAARRVRFVCDVVAFGDGTCNPVPLCSVANQTSAAGVALPAFSCSVPAGDAATGAARGELAVGATKNIWLRFEALDQPAPRGDVFNNVATVSANEPDTQAANDSESEATTVRQRVDLRTTKTASVPSPSLRQPFNWVVRVVNNGPGNSLQTDLTDTLPAGAEVTGPVSWTRSLQVGNGSCTVVGRAVSCALGQLDAGGEAVITIPSRFTSFPAGGTATNSATVDTDPDKTGGIDFPGGNNTGSTTVTVQRSSLGGTVFVDSERAGANAGTPQSAALEPRLAGVTLTLTGTDAYGNAVSTSVQTDADGNYRFDDLSPSDGSGYTITQTLPDATRYINGPADPPAAGAAAPTLGGSYARGGLAGASSYSGVLVGTNQNGTQYHFPELSRPALAGFVYVDANANGQRDAATDPAVAGATVRLLNADTGAVLATTSTAADGSYRFTSLDPLTRYTLEEPLPAAPTGLLNGPVNPGLVGGAACAAGCTAQPDTPAANTDRIATIDLASGRDGTAFNFGEVQQTFVAGTVWVDSNRNGVLDAIEAQRLANVTLRLVQGADCATGTTLQTATSAANGTWRFDNVRAYLDYLVCETQPTGYGTGSANGLAGNVATVTALPAAGSPNNNFGETLASIAGSVYQDAGNGVPAQFDNGQREAGEAGIAGVTVTLSGTDVLGNVVNLSTTTDASGNYLFDGLIAANAAGYTVSEGALPPSAGSLLDGKDTAGTAGGSAGALNDLISAVALSAGQQATGYLFGELPTATIGGTVYIDRNRDGVLDGGDGRLPGVTVRLVQGADCGTGTALQTSTTDAQGNYAFANVAVGGSYLVCEGQPVGYAQGSDNPGAGGSAAGANAIRITSLPAGGSTGNHFGENAASLAGSVYVDFSPATPANTDNGVRDAGETGIAGVTVTLTGRDIHGVAVSRSTVTDASGHWRFDDLLQSDASGYSVAEGAILPSAGSFNDGRDTAGTAGGSAVTNDQLQAIVLGAGVQGVGYLFGELPIAPITGTVYIDRDKDGALGGGDGGLGGVVIRLVLGANCSGTVVATTTTDASGNYTFSGVSAGLTYTLCETQPTGYGDGSTHPGTGGSSGTPNAITLANLPATGSAGNHFGERAATLAGSVWLDTNNDGTRQGAESGIAGVTVNLSGTDAAGNPVSRSTVTDASGHWRFIDLPAAGAGGYTVTEQAAQPVVGATTTLNGRTVAGSAGGSATTVAGTPSAIGAIALAAGSDGTDYRFGELLPASVSGSVFLDLDNNGQPGGPGETGLAGVPFTLTGTDDTGSPVSVTVNSGADGSWAFANLRPGSYTVTQTTQPAGTSNGITTAGSAGGVATAVGITPSAVSGFVLAPGTASTGNLFGELANNSVISGRVWLDADNDGTLGGGEAGLAGVTLELSGTDTAGRTVTRSTVTAADGSYLFEQLAPGTYAVREPQQPAGTVNGRTVAGTAGGAATAPGTAPSAVTAIVLGVGATSAGNDFGEVPAASVGGRVWADNNDNGRIDTGEAGLAGVTLVLTGTDDLGNAINTSTVSGSDGGYAFNGLRPGSYTVTEPVQPPGTVNGQTVPGPLGGTGTPATVAPSAISGIALPPGGAAMANHFGELANSPDLRVSKRLVGTRFTVGFPGTYVFTVRNVGNVATSASFFVADRLPAGMTLAATPSGAGWACTGAAGEGSFSCSNRSVLAAGATLASEITATVNVAAAAAAASPVDNVVLVEQGGEIDARGPSAAEREAWLNNAPALPVCSATVEHNACRVPTPVQLAASVSGTVWSDVGSASRLLDGTDRRLAGWLVEVVEPATGAIVGRATTAADGSYRVSGLLPGVPLAVRFRDPASGVVFGYPVNGETAPGSSGAVCDGNAAASGGTSSCAASGASPFLTVVLKPGEDLPQQSLPVDPSGVVYDSGLRQAVPGAVVTLAPAGNCAGWNPATGLVGAAMGGYTVNGGAVSMTVGADGFYQFLFAPAAPARCDFAITVTPPAGYTFTSTAIPPTPGPLLPPGAAGSSYAVQPQAAPPSGAVGPATSYYLLLSSGSGGANIIHNHIPLDPALPGAIALAKTGDKATAEIGDTVRYTLTVSVPNGALPRQTTIVDRLPAGFTYIRGTATVNDQPIADPQGGLGPQLAFHLGAMPASRQLVLRYRVRVGVGAQQGDGINRARGHACGVPTGCVNAAFAPFAGSVATNEAQYRVKVGGGVFTTDACVMGKVFVDCNGNHVQDPEEIGIPGVRLFVQDGTTLITDSEGKYSVCGVPPRSAVLKVDPITLPRGSRLTTSSNRNLGDAGSLWLDLKNGELHRADFVEGSCSNTVLEQVKARRAQGEVRAPENERAGRPALRFDSKAHGLTTTTSPQQGTDSANQKVPKPRPTEGDKDGGRDAAR